MMKNELLEEVWRNRDRFAKKHGHNIDAMVAALRKMERHPLTRIMDRRKTAAHSKTVLAAECK